MGTKLKFYSGTVWEFMRLFEVLLSFRVEFEFYAGYSVEQLDDGFQEEQKEHSGYHLKFLFKNSSLENVAI